MHSEKWCAIVKDISYVLTCTMWSSFKKIYCEKGIACARGFMFDIEVGQDMTYFNGMLYRALPFYKRNALVEGSTHFKQMHHSFSRVFSKVFEHVPRMSISKSFLRIHWPPMFLHLFNTVFERLHKQTKLPNLCPKPPKLPPVIPAFCHSFFTLFSNGTTGPKQIIKSTKNTFATPKVGELAKS